MSTQWPIVPLGEVLRLVQDPHPVRADEDYPNFGIYSFGRGLFPKQPISGATTSAKTLYRVRSGQFIYSRLFAFEGAYGLVTDEYDGHFVSNEYPTFDCDQTRLVPEFLGLYFNSPKVWRAVAQQTKGMGDRRQRIHPEQILAHHAPMPAVTEQRKIVKKLDAVTAMAAEARVLRSTSCEEATALLNSCRRQLIGDKPAPDWIPLSTVVTRIENGWSPACEKRPATNGEWGVLKVGAVSFGYYEPRENKVLPPTLQPKPEYAIKAGDFLMSRANTVSLVGACAVVEQTPPRLLLCDKIFRFDFKDSMPIDRHYIDHVIKSPALRQQIERGASGTSPTMKNISKEKVLGLLIPSHTLPEQCRIAKRLTFLDRRVQHLRSVQDKTKEELEAMMPAILNKAFSGEL